MSLKVCSLTSQAPGLRIVRQRGFLKPELIPALRIELKGVDETTAWNHQENYPDNLERYRGKLILARINYDRNMSNERAAFMYHSCEIEKA